MFDPGVNLVKLFQVQFTSSVAIALAVQDNSCTCKLHLKKF